MADENELVEITDEQGNKMQVQVIDIITVDDVEYALLVPAESEEDGCGCGCDSCGCGCEEEMVLMRVKKDGEEYSFETIENDEEFEKVAAYIDEMADEMQD